MTLILRTVVGRPLTHTEHDGNFTYLEQAIRDLEQFVIGNFVAALYGSMDGTDVIPASIGGGWLAVAGYDTEPFTSKGITVNLANGTLAFPYGGLFNVTFTFNFAHNELNQGRTTQLRLFNLTDGVPAAGTAVTLGVGRNTEATFVSVSFLFEVIGADMGKEFQVQIGNGSSFTVLASFATFEAFAAGEARGIQIPGSVSTATGRVRSVVSR